MSTEELQGRRFTESEYLELMLISDQKCEFNDGVVTIMAGNKRAHNLTKRNFYGALISGRGTCKLYNSDVAVYIEKLKRYFFPDISGLCGPENYTDIPGIERILNPQLIIEVLAKGTASYDLGEKFDAYKQLDSFREYIVVDSRSYLIWTYYREAEGLWRIGNYYRLDQEVEIITFGVKVPMSVIYEGVEVEE